MCVCVCVVVVVVVPCLAGNEGILIGLCLCVVFGVAEVMAVLP